MKQGRNEAVESIYEKMIMIQHEISAVQKVEGTEKFRWTDKTAGPSGTEGLLELKYLLEE